MTISHSVDTQTCKRCGQTKSVSEFHRHAAEPTGYRTICKECRKPQSLIYRLSNLDKIREYDRKRGSLEHRKERVRANSHKYSSGANEWRLANPQKARAHNAVSNAIREGRLVRPEYCESCGETGEIQAHHEDYTKQLDVNWLCVCCHSKRHKVLNEIRRKALNNA